PGGTRRLELRCRTSPRGNVAGRRDVARRFAEDPNGRNVALRRPVDAARRPYRIAACADDLTRTRARRLRNDESDHGPASHEIIAEKSPQHLAPDRSRS